MSQWLLSTPQETISQDHRAGGLWRWTMINDEDGTRYPTEFREIVESERLVFTWGAEDNRPAVITLTFDDHDGGTRLTLHLVGPAEFITDETGVEKGLERAVGQPGDVPGAAGHLVSMSISSRTWVSNTASGSVSVSAPY